MQKFRSTCNSGKPCPAVDCARAEVTCTSNKWTLCTGSCPDAG